MSFPIPIKLFMDVPIIVAPNVPPNTMTIAGTSIRRANRAPFEDERSEDRNYPQKETAHGSYIESLLHVISKNSKVYPGERSHRN